MLCVWIMWGSHVIFSHTLKLNTPNNNIPVNEINILSLLQAKNNNTRDMSFGIFVAFVTNDEPVTTCINRNLHIVTMVAL